MANKASRHGRRLVVFVLAVLAMYGGLALSNEWTPKLGLDLQRGTRITLEASTETGEAITPEKLDEAAGIIDLVTGAGYRSHSQWVDPDARFALTLFMAE